jgi:fused signal recognition particle receptor
MYEVLNSFSPTHLAEFGSLIIFILGFGLFKLSRSRSPTDKVSPEALEIPEASKAPETPEALEALEALEAPKAPKNLKSVMTKTREAFLKKLDSAFLSTKHFDESFLESLEEILYTSDLGPATVEKLLTGARSKLSRGELKDLKSVKLTLQSDIEKILLNTKNVEAFASNIKDNPLPAKPWVILVVGVNGVGKTTSIGKLAHYFAVQNKKVLVVAGDTFRAAAGAQLTVWSERAKVDVFNSDKTTDSAAVAYEGIQRGLSEKYDVVIVDTAGRLHNKENLMEELKKVKRVMAKALSGAPHETILVIDANSGQNALVQTRQFNDAVGVTSLIVTKLDGTARGGVIVGIADELSIPVQYIGVGEKLVDLEIFNPNEYARALLGESEIKS